jgi:enolase
VRPSNCEIRVSEHRSGNGKLRETAIGFESTDQQGFDAKLQKSSCTPDKSRLGANAILAVSMASCVASARSQHIPFFEHIASLSTASGDLIPRPQIQIIGRGAGSEGAVEIKDFSVVAPNARDFREYLEITDLVFRRAGERMKTQGKILGCADKGGYWPAFRTCEEALDLLAKNIESGGLKLGHDAAISVDIAAAELKDNTGSYHF